MLAASVRCHVALVPDSVAHDTVVSVVIVAAHETPGLVEVCIQLAQQGTHRKWFEASYSIILCRGAAPTAVESTHLNKYDTVLQSPEKIKKRITAC